MSKFEKIMWILFWVCWVIAAAGTIVFFVLYGGVL